MKKALSVISWGMIAEGTFYGFLSMSVAEELVLNPMMPVSWGFFSVYLVSRCAKHYFPKAENTLVKIAVPCRRFAWFLMVAATALSGCGAD